MRVNPNYSAEIVNLLEQTQQEQDAAMQEVSTGRQVSEPSDNPAAEGAMIEENANSSSVDQYTSNCDALTEVLNTADSTLGSVVTALQRASTLAVEAANGTMNQSDLNSISSEISGIKSEIVSLANTSYAGRYLFAGTATSTVPYVTDATDPSQIDYAGNDRQNNVQIGTGLTVASNLPGSSIFSQSGSNVFTALQSLIDALGSGSSSQISSAASNIDDALNAVDTARVFYGNTVDEITAQESYLSQEKLNIESQQSSLVSIDADKAATDLEQAEYARSATVAAASKLDQTSLLDYLQ
jgi:flagellar hook-associated protein 3 FlgL